MRSSTNLSDATSGQSDPGRERQEDRPELLFVSPTFPDSQGNGLAMRAGMFVEALASRYRVSLLTVPLFDNRTPTSDALIRQYCEREFVVPPWHSTGALTRLTQRFDTRPELLRLFAGLPEAAAALRYQHFDFIHAFRLYTAPLAIALAAAASGRPRPRLHLDLDDVESSTRARLADLYQLNGLEGRAEAEAREAKRFGAAEKRLLPAFERVYVCSEQDAARIQALAPGRVRLAPNTIRPPGTPATPMTSHPFTFLFVGTLDYYPNEDAVRYFCAEVLPVLRARTGAAFHVRIAGPATPGRFAALSRLEGVRLVGKVPDVRAEYANAEAVVVPIRGGGGTRIKMLEAFAYQRPVVSTSAGAEGIEAIPEEHFLLGNTPVGFATQCLRLMEEPGLGPALVAKAFALVAAKYSPGRIAAAIEPST